MTSLAEVRQAAEAAGLAVCGGFHPSGEDGAPAGSQTLVLLGYGGPALWRAFSASAEAHDGAPDPLDRWSRRVIDGLAKRLGATAYYPFGGPPYQPFLRWAARAEAAWPSRLGMTIQAERGLWTAYRGALAFDHRLDLPDPGGAERPCEGCAAPCLTACPVGAFSDDGYDVAACVAHLAAPEGAPCRDGGCLARRACPVGVAYRHEPAQAAFHMTAFLAARLADKAP